MISRTLKYISPAGTFSWNVLKHKFDYFKRLFGTALGYTFFGIGGFLLCLTLFPMVMALSRSQEQKLMRVRSIIHYSFRAFLKFLQFFGVLDVRTSQLSAVQNLKGTIIISNHPTLLDVVVIMAQIKNLQCIVKKELWSNPLLGGVVRSAGYIRNDMPPEEFLAACDKQLRLGGNIIIFPEGTRTTPGHPIELRRGFGNLALAACANIQTLILECKPSALSKMLPWYKIPPKRMVFQLKAGRLFAIKEYLDDSPRSIRVRALMRDIQHYYNRKLGYAPSGK